MKLAAISNRSIDARAARTPESASADAAGVVRKKLQYLARIPQRCIGALDFKRHLTKFGELLHHALRRFRIVPEAIALRARLALDQRTPFGCVVKDAP